MVTISNTNNIHPLEKHYSRADGVLEAKSTTFLGKLVQWIKIKCNPTLYKADCVVKRYIFNTLNSSTAPSASLETRDIEFLVRKLKQNYPSPEHSKTVKTYELAICFFRSITSQNLKNIEANSDTDPYTKKMIIFKNGFRASGYTNELFIDKVAEYLSGSDNIINCLDNLKEEEQLPYLLNLVEDFKQLHISIYNGKTSFPESLQFCASWDDLIDLCRCSSSTGDKDPNKMAQLSHTDLNTSRRSNLQSNRGSFMSWMERKPHPGRWNND